MKKAFIEEFAFECDRAIESNNIEEIDLMLAKSHKLEQENDNNDKAIAYILYCIANLYSEKAKISEECIGNWRNDVFPENQINALNYLRKASIRINDYSYPYNPLEIQTNIANSLNAFCRVIEANELWTFDYNFDFLNDANFVAPFRKSATLRWLSQFLNDPSHSDYYNYEAYNLLKMLCDNKDNILHPGIRNDITNNPISLEFIKRFDEVKAQFETYKELSANIKYKNIEELNYRKWCLKNKLFLNPMNDITDELVAAQDILQFPNYIVKIGEGPFFSSAFSDIKNRFCKARYMFFTALNKKYPKWLEDDLYLTDTLDYVDFSTSTEDMKVSFRLCFSILDSLASLVNKYFEIDSDKPFFKPSWIKNNLAYLKNPFIDALYWLSCDLIDNSSIKNWKAPNPSSSTIRILRNNFEHNWVRISDRPNSVWTGNHDYAQTISRETLEFQTLSMFKYTRSAILYFTFAVTINEEGKYNSDKPIPSIDVPICNHF